MPEQSNEQPSTANLASQFGRLVKSRRKKLGMTQDDVALASGVSRRFVIELESGRSTCELGRSLMVASVVGLKILEQSNASNAEHPMLPDILDDGGPQ
jgi:transcriptional regulator with XRE-family HTH domain